MERQLSSLQRDKLLFDESKEDSQFKSDIAEAIREQMSQSIMFIAKAEADQWK